MTSQELIIRHEFNGGWASDFGPSVFSAPERGGRMPIPFLLKAENCVLELDGGPHMTPGTAKLNSSALASGAEIKGIFDVWFQGSSGSPTQHRVVHVGTVIMEDDADGTFANLFTGLEADKVPTYAVLNDLLVLCSTSTADVPKSWDGTTAQDLAGTPPNFSIVTEHRGRLWAAGVATAPSTLYYSVLGDPEDWVGSGSGNINIAPDDGDQITGLASHRGELLVFKGPYKGSIHRMQGAAPTGDDPFRITPFTKAPGAAWHNGIFTRGTDLGFIGPDGLIYSLAATENFGDFAASALSLPINGWICEHINRGALAGAWAVEVPEESRVYFALPIDASTSNNIILVMDYRFEPVRWTSLPVFDTEASSLALVVDATANNRRRLFGGGSDGFVRKFGEVDRSIDGATALGFNVQTPYFTYGSPIQMKTLSAAGVGHEPKSAGDFTFNWQRDNNAEQSVTLTQTGVGDVLAPATAGNDFTLDTSTLGGGQFGDVFTRLGEEGGEFRAISYRIASNTVNEDLELHSLTAMGSGGAISLEN